MAKQGKRSNQRATPPAESRQARRAEVPDPVAPEQADRAAGHPQAPGVDRRDDRDDNQHFDERKSSYRLFDHGCFERFWKIAVKPPRVKTDRRNRSVRMQKMGVYYPSNLKAIVANGGRWIRMECSRAIQGTSSDFAPP